MNGSCAEKDCNRKFYARGYCKWHYSKHRHSGYLPKLPVPCPKGCSIDGCNEKHTAKGLCQKHYRAHLVKTNPSVYKNLEVQRHLRCQRLKQKIIDGRGGGCELCGYRKNIACLEFHHKDPRIKEYEPKRVLRTQDLLRIGKELNGCIVVCKNCHTEIHHPLLNVFLPSAEPKEEVAP